MDCTGTHRTRYLTPNTFVTRGRIEIALILLSFNSVSVSGPIRPPPPPPPPVMGDVDKHEFDNREGGVHGGGGTDNILACAASDPERQVERLEKCGPEKDF
jgi:hypothetical protein